MKISYQYIYISIYTLVLLALTLFPSVEFAIIISVLLIFITSVNKGTLDTYLINIIGLLLIIVFIGVISSVFRAYSNRDILRDLIHYIKPILMLAAGYLIANKIDKSRLVLKTILLVAAISSIYHILNVAILVDFSNFDINKLRFDAGLGTFIELIAMILLLASKKYKIFNVINNKRNKKLILFLLITSFILYFSRTMLLGLVVFSLAVFGYAKLNMKGVKYASGIVVILVVTYTILFNLKLDPDKPGLESFFYKIRNAPLEMFSSPEGYDSQDHRRIFDRWRAYEAKMALEQMNDTKLNYLFGKGFGSLVDLQFVAPLNNKGMQYIPIIHNGYVYVFFKTGLVGLCIYLLFLASLYFQSYKKSVSTKEMAFRYLISGFGFYYIATSFVITGIYNLEETSSFLLGSFLFLLKSTRKNTPK